MKKSQQKTEEGNWNGTVRREKKGLQEHGVGGKSRGGWA